MRLCTGQWNSVASATMVAFMLVFIEDDGTARLRVEFKNGGTYEYQKVGLAIVMGLAQAASKGQYFARNIKGANHFRQISPKWTEPK